MSEADRDASEKVEREALRRVRERADELVTDWQEAFWGSLPGNHSLAEAALLAHLMTGNDGYKPVCLISDWERRPMSGWVTSLAFLPELAPQLHIQFALEVRHGKHARQLAVLLDGVRPEDRTADKLQREAKLLALNFRVVAFSEREVLRDPTTCRQQIEAVLAELAGDVLVDADLGPEGIMDDGEPQPRGDQ